MDVAWLRNGKDIPDSEDFRYINRGNICQLEIAEIFPEDGGKYTCEVLNDLGDAECNCNISVSGMNVRGRGWGMRIKWGIKINGKYMVHSRCSCRDIILGVGAILPLSLDWEKLGEPTLAP